MLSLCEVVSREAASARAARGTGLTIKRVQPGEGVTMADQNSATPWRKSSLCGPNTGCLEVRLNRGGIEIRDSKDPSQAKLYFTGKEWAAFLGGVLRGEFDLDGLAQEGAGVASRAASQCRSA